MQLACICVREVGVYRKSRDSIRRELCRQSLVLPIDGQSLRRRTHPQVVAMVAVVDRSRRPYYEVVAMRWSALQDWVSLDNARVNRADLKVLV